VKEKNNFMSFQTLPTLGLAWGSGSPDPRGKQHRTKEGEDENLREQSATLSLTLMPVQQNLDLNLQC
jgi:hypothetical protein